MPVYHETTAPSQNNVPAFKPSKFTPSTKNVKWEPTSESEMSEYEGEPTRRHNQLQGSRWEPSSCSPVSLSPSLPSTSPAFNNNYCTGISCACVLLLTAVFSWSSWTSSGMSLYSFLGYSCRNVDLHRFQFFIAAQVKHN